MQPSEKPFCSEVQNADKFAVAVFAAALLCIIFAVDVCTVSRQKQVGTEIESTINPNYSPAASLVRLPGIGLARAQQIVSYRENFAGQNNSGTAFESADDLLKVKGLGPKTVENIRQWLKFEPN